MKLIVGLGNPGTKYSKTRHNIGFMVVDTQASTLREQWRTSGNSKNSEIIQTKLESESVIFQKPMTYMNSSGEAVLDTIQFFKIQVGNICVIHDDLDLPFGDVRLKISGGDGGHNGLISIIHLLGENKFSRIRMGIGRPSHPQEDPSDFVLGQFRKDEQKIVEDMIIRALQGITAFIKGETVFKNAMSVLNKKGMLKNGI